MNVFSQPLKIAVHLFAILSVVGLSACTGFSRPGVTPGSAPIVVQSITVQPLSLSVIEDTQRLFSINASSAAGNVLQFSILGNPENGQIIGFNPQTGTGQYLPSSNFNGQDFFAVKVSDGTDEAVLNVSVEVIPVNDVPSLAPISNLIVQERGTVTVTLQSVDVERDPLSFSVVTAPTKGTATISGNSLQYQPNATASGSDSFSVRVSDGVSNSPTRNVSVTIVPVNDPPTVNPLPTFSLNEDEGFSEILSGTDPEGAVLTFSLATPPQHGNVMEIETFVDQGVEYWYFYYVPNPNYFGTDKFKVVASDGMNSSQPYEINLTIKPVNDVPTVSNINVNATAGVAVDSRMIGRDVENDTLNFVVSAPPTKGTVTILNAQTGTFRFTPFPNTKGEDRFLFTASDSQGTSQQGVATIDLPAIPNPPINLNPNLDKVLVIYNENATASEQIADYYISRRGINTNRKCPVRMPPGLYATWEQLLEMRKTIVENCLCRLVSVPNCGVATLDEVAAISPVTHLAIIRGVPLRLKAPPQFAYGIEDPALDSFLAHFMYKEDGFYVPDSGYFSGGALDYPARHSDYRGRLDGSPFLWYGRTYPAIDPARHRVATYGRIEALTPESTMAMIDRTLAAEKAGFTGNVFSNAHPVYTEFLRTTNAAALRDVVNARDQKCVDYLRTGIGTWLDVRNECRWGANSVSESSTPALGQIPIALRTGLYLGQEIPPASHQITVGGRFDRLLKWHKSEVSCNELCGNDAACRAASTDIFKEIDTRCVGGSPNLMGWQLRSWPVAYYGIYPRYWTSSTNNGASERSAPFRTQGAAYNVGPFANDNYFIRFGATDASLSPMCPVNGVQQPCQPSLAPNLMSDYLELPSVVTLPADFTVKYRYRHPVGTGRLKMTIYYYDVNKAELGNTPSAIQPLAVTGEWTTVTATVTPPSGSAKYLRLVILGFFGDNITGQLDIDGIEVLDAAGTNLVPVEMGSFSAPYINNLAPGDWAANFIDRLGAIAWWGSSSHFGTNGFAFSGVEYFTTQFFGGRSLGESVYASGTRASGLFFGDPLYSPGAVKLYLDRGEDPIYELHLGNDGSKTAKYVIDAADATTYEKALKMRAVHGRDKTATTQWRLDVCEKAAASAVTRPSANTCDADQSWAPLQINGVVQQGSGATMDRVLTSDLRNIVQVKTGIRVVFLRLRVWNTNEESNALHSFAFFQYRPAP